MIVIDQQKYESIIEEIINTKDIKTLVSKYLKDKIYYYSILHDISDEMSPNRELVRNVAHGYKLSRGYVVEQSNTLLNYISPKPPELDYYEILKVSPDASKEEIRRSWTGLMKDYHPDLIGEKGLEMSRKINEAYAVLKDDKKKSSYDEMRMPHLKVKVRRYRKFKFNNIQKAAVALTGVVIILMFFFYSLKGEKRTELADYRNFEISGEQGSSEITKLDENKKILNQIDKIEPISKKKGEEVTAENRLVDKPKSNLISNDNEKESVAAELNSLSDENIKIEKKVENKSVVDDAKPVKKTINTKNPERLEKNEIKNEKASSTKITGSDNEIKKVEDINPEKVSVNEQIQPKSTDEQVRTEPTSSSLYRFVSEYVTAYKSMDVKKISSLFSEDARENGLPVTKAIDMYSKNFNNNEIIKYDLKIKSTKIKEKTGHVDSDFNIVFEKRSSREIKTTNGSITWNLLWNDESWKIKDLNYSIYNTKDMNGSVKR